MQGPVPTPPARPIDRGQGQAVSSDAAKRAPAQSATAPAQSATVVRAPIAPVSASAKATPAPLAPARKVATGEAQANFQARFAPAVSGQGTLGTLDPGSAAPVSAFAPRTDQALTSGRGLY
jgi:hypothetical protein